MDMWRYVVWVGGVDDYYTTYEKAKNHYEEWIAKGYNDVLLFDLDKGIMEESNEYTK